MMTVNNRSDNCEFFTLTMHYTVIIHALYILLDVFSIVCAIFFFVESAIFDKKRAFRMHYHAFIWGLSPPPWSTPHKTCQTPVNIAAVPCLAKVLVTLFEKNYIPN